MCRPGGAAAGLLQEVGWLAQVWAQSSLGTRVLGSLVEGWFQLLLDSAEKREKQAFSLPSESCQAGRGWGVGIAKPPLGSNARCGGTGVAGRGQGAERGGFQVN